MPPGATVREGATSLGNSPVELMIAEGVRARTLDVEMRDHKKKTLVVDRDQKNPLVVTLEALPKAAPAPAPAPAATKRKRTVKRPSRRSAPAPAKKAPKAPKPKKPAMEVW